MTFLQQKRYLSVLLFTILLRQTVQVCNNKNHTSFYGGTMSFEVEKTGLLYEATINVLTAWKIGKGPCGSSCDYGDIGKSTSQVRHNLLQKFCATYLGVWVTEKSFTNSTITQYENKTAEVTNTITERVQLVNKGLQWEMDLAVIKVHFESGTDYFDIKYEGKYWVDSNLNQGRNHPIGWFLQAKIKPGIRSDTRQSNKSPIVQLKPYQRFLFGNVTKININTLDPEKDLVTCGRASLGTSNWIRFPRGLHVDELDCSLTFDVSTVNGYHVGMTGIVIMDVMDLNTEDIFVESGNESVHRPRYNFYGPGLSTIPVQGQPYFIIFPNEIECGVNSVCTFPIHATTDDKRGLLSIKYIITDGDIDVQLITEPKTFQRNISADVNIKSSTRGLKRLCFNATDRRESTVQCNNVKIIPEDPCLSSPCQNSGQCVSSEDTYICACLSSTTGRLCETLDKCDPNPCLYGGECFDGYCICRDRFTGIHCDASVSDCTSSTCKDGICVTREHGFECLCAEHSNSTACIKRFYSNKTNSLNSRCADDSRTVNCNNGGMCSVNAKGLEVCICPDGYVGDECQTELDTTYERKSKNATFVPPTPLFASTIKCDIMSGGIDHNLLCEFPVFVFWEDQQQFHSNTTRDISVTAEFLPTDMKIGQPSRAMLERRLHVFPVNGFNNTYFGTVVLVSSNNLVFEAGIHDVCLSIKHGLTVTDHRCFNVDVVKKVWINTKNLLGINGTVFKSPTLPDGSVIQCLENSVCHIHIYTNSMKQSCSRPVIETGAPSTVFGPSLIKLNAPGSPVCHFDVAFDTSGLDKNNMHELCMLANKHGEPRCFMIHITHYTKDPCSNNPCKNNGLCNTNANATIVCLCRQGFNGNNCEIGKCPDAVAAKTKCINGGVCYADGVGNLCFCRVGFFGDKCQYSVTMGQKHAIFSSTGMPSIINCYIGKPCVTEVTLASNLTSPTIQTGFTSKFLEINSITLDKDNTNNSMHHSTVTLLSKTAGIHRCCFQTIDAQSPGVTDEICFRVNVSNDNPVAAVSWPLPSFSLPSFPPFSTLECSTSQSCHILFYVNPVNGKCPTVSSSIKPEDGVFVFITKRNGTCFGDATVQSTSIGNMFSCFTLVSDENRVGEQRCYTISIKSGSLKAQGQCGRNISCSNGGFCHSTHEDTKCLCRDGFSGRLCEIPHRQIIQTANGSLQVSLALPKKLVCLVNEECVGVLPLNIAFGQVLTPTQSNNGVQIQFQEIKQNKKKPENQVTVIHMKGSFPGLHTTCFEPKTTRESRLCFDVDIVKPTVNHQSTTQNQPHFVAPTVPNGSTIKCVVGYSCHVLMFMSSPAYNLCPQIKLIEGLSEEMHLFSDSHWLDFIGNCSADVVFTPQNGTTGQCSKYCFQSLLPTFPGETRCFFVEFENTTAASTTISISITQPSTDHITSPYISTPKQIIPQVAGSTYSSGATQFTKPSLPTEKGNIYEAKEFLCEHENIFNTMINLEPRPCAIMHFKAAGIGAGVIVVIITITWIIKCICTNKNSLPSSNSVKRETTVVPINIPTTNQEQHMDKTNT